MKGLEALEELKFQVGNITYHTRDLQITTFKVRDSGLFEIIEKELKEYQEIKEIAKHYNWDDITSEIFNVKADKKYRDLFNSAIVNIQEDYRKARALEIIKRTAMKLVSLEDDTTICIKGRYAFYDNELYKSEDLTKEEYDLLKEVLL